MPFLFLGTKKGIQLFIFSLFFGYANFSDAENNLHTNYEELRPFQNGIWWSRSESGHGLDIQYAGDIIFIVLYTFDESGDPIWYTAQAKLKGNKIDTELLHHQWDPVKHQYLTHKPDGHIKLNIENRYNITATVNLYGRQKELSLVPFIYNNISLESPKGGLWFNPENPGYGISYGDQGSWKVGIIYLYDETGMPTWIYSSSLKYDETFDMTKVSGYCLGCEKVNKTNTSVGKAKFRFDSENHGKVDLEFDSNEIWMLKDSPIERLSKQEKEQPSLFKLSKLTSNTELAAYLREGYLHLSEDTFPYAYLDMGYIPKTKSSRIDNAYITDKSINISDHLKSDESCVYIYPSEKPNTISSHELNEASEIRFSRREINPESNVGVPYYSRAESELGLHLNSKYLISIASRVILNESPTPWKEDMLWESNGKSATISIFERELCEAHKSSEISLSGRIVSSLRNENQLFIIWRSVPSVEFNPDTDQKDNAVQVLGHLQLEKLTPQIKIDDQPWQSAIDNNNSYVIANQEHPSSNFILVTRINLDTPGDIKTVAVIGQVESFNLSDKALYLFSHRQGYLLKESYAHESIFSTQVHKISLNENISYAGSGSVEGFFNKETHLAQRQFNEIDDGLAIMNEVYSSYSGIGQLSILTPSESQSGLWINRSRLPNKKRPEPLRTYRGTVKLSQFRQNYFLDNKLYLGPYAHFDGWHVVNLSNSYDPHIESSFTMPGDMQYLRSLPNNKLLSIGTSGTSPNNIVNLLDISKPNSPTLLRSIGIGDMGSEMAIQDSKFSFSYSPKNDAGNARFAIPMVLRELDPRSTTGGTRWVSSGLHEFEFNKDFSDMSLLQSWNQHDTILRKNNRLHWAESAMNGRANIRKDQVLYFEGGRLWGAQWGADKHNYGPYISPH
ncbi:beta-propeller domain-containing protein [Pseudoteredinibacter isoporae]|uniref:beta-propeller domain-containing protein n=1 Tax=Pseudoteredinibacter isoporae TaxID=570281 RepID=UPI003103183A